jgi:hypothetical protein
LRESVNAEGAEGFKPALETPKNAVLFQLVRVNVNEKMRAPGAA